MAGNFQADLSGDILVEFDYNNIVLVDPNKTIDSRGVIKERLVDHENLVMFANLEAEILPRTKLALGIQPGENVSTSMTIAKINFLRPNQGNVMTSGYLDEITGKDSLVGRGQNQPQETTVVDSQNRAYFRQSIVDQQSVFDNGLLGITSINVRVSTSFIPSVSMQLEDIQGRALFQLGDQSPYAAFFNLPYPQFYLTLKGYYGQAIRYQLNLEKFDARFNTSTGNYTISLEFRGFKFNILNEILISHLMATPHMYNKRFSVGFNPETANSSTNDNTLLTKASGQQSGKINTSNESSLTSVQDYVTEKGYEKIVEVYSEYKSKGLLPPDFPELTLMQLVYKLEMFEQNIINAYPKANVEPLTNIKNYKSFLLKFFENIRGATGSWFSRNLNPNPIILKDKTKIYYFREEIRKNPQVLINALKELENITKEYLGLLGKNPTLGVGRKDKIELDNLNYNNFFYTDFRLNEVSTGETTTSFTSILSPNSDLITQTVEQVKTIYQSSNIKIENSKENILALFVFEGQNRFDSLVRYIDSIAAQKLATIEEAISQNLAEFIQDSATGIGFNPTARNVIGVIMANAEGFIRLMEDVHTNSWSVRDDPTRKLIIQNNTGSIPNPEAKNVIRITTQAANQNQGIVNSEEPVYPWPQFFVESPDDKKGRFQLKYLGDPSVVDLTQAYNFKIWPEVEFVEEYIKGLAQKDNPPNSQPPLSSQLTTLIQEINAIQFPPDNLPYSNKQEIKFFYEIWERQYITSFYSNYIRANGNQRNQLLTYNTETESENILESLGQSNPFLSFKLKYQPLNGATYPEFLKSISANGTGRLFLEFERDFFTTPYIIQETENPFKIYKTTELGLQAKTNTAPTALNQLVKDSSNTPIIFDTYPFTYPNWVKENMALSNQATLNNVYNTYNSLKVYESRNVISNFTDIYEYKLNRPVTNFCYLDAVQPTLTTAPVGTQNQSLVDYYSNLQDKPKFFVPTVGYVENPTSKNLPVTQTTSILNTPYFINAVQRGVALEKSNNSNPYIQAAYLFLNSLPLGTLRERYKNYGSTSELDYIASCFNKYGAIHKMPYAWVLKLGSVWHRYKTFIDSGTDILDSVWTDFDYVNNYDPIGNSKTKLYKFKPNITANTETIVLEKVLPNNEIQMNVGFYPKLINDFAYFYSGKDLFKDYNDTEIQSAVSDGMFVYNSPNSNFNANQSGNTVFLKTWSVLLPDNVQDTFTSPNTCIPTNNPASGSTFYYIVPSFGANINQSKSQCLQVPNSTDNVISNTVEPVSGNTSVFNGSVRTLWSASNYGYFDSKVIQKPSPDEYMFKLETNSGDISPIRLKSIKDYSKIEEIFGVFDKKTLNILEKEFLDFCKPAKSYQYKPQNSEINVSLIELDATLRNFQLFMRSSMEVERKQSTNTNQDFFQKSINFQFDNFRNNVRSLMEYDIILKNGNPSKYSRRVFNSFIQTPGLKNPITFNKYVSGSLPTNGGTTTLLQSQQLYPTQWEQLQIDVGFSTIPGLVYSDNGSYITDFFVDNDIEFSVRNINLLSQVIKIYATQKLLNPSITSIGFKNSLSSFLNEESNLQNQLLDSVIAATKKGIGPITRPQDQSIKSTLSGTQGKAELYNLFKTINDKWIAGTDYTSRTLFEDVLFLDRASRNIGDTIILDIFGVKNLINSTALNEQMSVYTLVSGLLMQNNFTVMPLPAYVNFYNVQSIDGVFTPNGLGTTEFGNRLWGTYTNVDYTKAGPKMVCFYVGKPSEQLALPKEVSGYGDDGFDLRNPNNPLVENQENTNFELSNKCVGFTVDVGIRNQNVFQNFSVSQDTGKATSETISALLTMIDQTNTRNVTTQNQSLYNLYKRRSYQCDVTSLGNALLQPTMYFNLRHIPMFNGPYLITEVNHVITAGDFTTNFKGVRQGIYDFPPIDSFIQKINQNLLSKIEAQILQQTDQNTTIATTQQARSNDLMVNSSSLVLAAENSCLQNLSTQFQYYVSERGNTVNIPQKDFVDALKRKIANNAQLQTIIYLLSYVRTYSQPGKEGGNFLTQNYNLGKITLEKPIPGGITEFMEKLKYSCIEVDTVGGKKTLPAARFETLDKYIDFMSGLLSGRVNQIIAGQVIQYYCTSFPSGQVSLDYYQKNENSLLEEFTPVFEQALVSASKQGLITDFRINPSQPAGAPNNLNTQVANPPTCPDTTIASFDPVSGRTGTIVSLSGTNMEYVREVIVEYSNIIINVDLRTIQFIDTNKIKFSIPTIPGITVDTNIRIGVKTVNNVNVWAPGTFNFRVS